MKALTADISYEIEGNVLTLTINLSGPGKRSASGKNLVLASTRGNVRIPEVDVMLGLNIYRK